MNPAVRSRPSVAEAMVTRPVLHDATTTVAEAAAALADPHRHLLLLVRGGHLLGTLVRGDLDGAGPGGAPALEHAQLAGRVVAPGAPLAEVHREMVSTGQRRRAVVSEDGALQGLLCLKGHGRGFCSDAGIACRAQPSTITP